MMIIYCIVVHFWQEPLNILASMCQPVNHNNIMFVPMLSVIQYGLTGLMRASVNGHTSTMRIFLEAKADPNIIDEVKVHYNCLYNSMVAQKGHVKYQFQYFQLPILKSTSNNYGYFSLPIWIFSFLTSSMYIACGFICTQSTHQCTL